MDACQSVMNAPEAVPIACELRTVLEQRILRDSNHLDNGQPCAAAPNPTQLRLCCFGVNGVDAIDSSRELSSAAPSFLPFPTNDDHSDRSDHSCRYPSRSRYYTVLRSQVSINGWNKRPICSEDFGTLLILHHAFYFPPSRHYFITSYSVSCWAALSYSVETHKHCRLSGHRSLSCSGPDTRIHHTSWSLRNHLSINVMSIIGKRNHQTTERDQHSSSFIWMRTLICLVG